MIDYSHREYLGVGVSVVNQPVNTKVVVAAFTLSNGEDSVSTIVGTANLGNTTNITFARPPLQMVANRDTSYKLTVRFQNEDGDTLRYVLFDGNDAFTLLYDDYAGQTITPDAVIEVWANPENVTIMSSDDLIFWLNTNTRRTVENGVTECESLATPEINLTIT